MTAANDNAGKSQANDNLPDRFLKMRDVMNMTSLGSSTIYRKLEDGIFPRPRELSTKCVRWMESEILEWMRGLPVSEPYGGQLGSRTRNRV